MMIDDDDKCDNKMFSYNDYDNDRCDDNAITMRWWGNVSGVLVTMLLLQPPPSLFFSPTNYLYDLEFEHRR